MKNMMVAKFLNKKFCGVGARFWLINGNFTTLEEAYRACPRADWLLCTIHKMGFINDTTLFAYALFVIRQTLWHPLTTTVQRRVLKIVEAYLDGKVSYEDAKTAAFEIKNTMDRSMEIDLALSDIIQATLFQDKVSQSSVALNIAARIVSSHQRSNQVDIVRKMLPNFFTDNQEMFHESK